MIGFTSTELITIESYNPQNGCYGHYLYSAISPCQIIQLFDNTFFQISKGFAFAIYSNPESQKAIEKLERVIMTDKGESTAKRTRKVATDCEICSEAMDRRNDRICQIGCQCDGSPEFHASCITRWWLRNFNQTHLSISQRPHS
jgi:hypothetical protein